MNPAELPLAPDHDGSGVRLIYLADARIPSRATNSMQVMRMCAAFQRAGAQVTLLCPDYDDPAPEGYNGDVWSFYGINARFELRRLSFPFPAIVRRSPALSQALRATLYTYRLLRLLGRSGPPTIFYGRSPLALWLVDRLRRLPGAGANYRGVYLELHTFPSDRRTQQLLSRVDGVIAISQALADAVVSRLGLDRARVWVEHDGVDFDAITSDTAQARRRVCEQLDLQYDCPILVYTGRVNADKGAGTLLKMAELLRDTRYQIVLVGKVYDTEYERRVAQAGWEHVRLVGFVPPAQIPDFLAAADVLLLPSTQDLPYADYMSPLKLFEYMASGRPIVASDLPVLREILRPGENALLAPPNQPEIWVSAVQALNNAPERAASLARQALADVQSFSWQERAGRILRRIEQQRPIREPAPVRQARRITRGTP